MGSRTTEYHNLNNNLFLIFLASAYRQFSSLSPLALISLPLIIFLTTNIGHGLEEDGPAPVLNMSVILTQAAASARRACFFLARNCSALPFRLAFAFAISNSNFFFSRKKRQFGFNGRLTSWGRDLMMHTERPKGGGD